jgi:hypothetical protein
MEKETEQQVLKELKSINQSLEKINSKIDEIEKDGKPGFVLGDLLKSLLIGVLVIGPVIAVIIVASQVVGSWLFG